MNWFIDTSALIKLYHYELGTDNLVQSFSRYPDDLIVTLTDLSRVECHSTLMKQVRIGKLSQTKATEVSTLLEQQIKRFRIVTVDSIAKEFAIQLLHQIAYQNNLVTLDAMNATRSGYPFSSRTCY
ncbi:MAG: type II toxin-antitoxin system VapC family toxin [Thioploca sp.]|nr:type II toxin-antitoxin system VapC family toxin [Thioploca sp.]